MLQIYFCTIEWGIAYVLTKIKWGFAENKNSQPKLKGYPNLLGVYILGGQFRGQFFKSIIFNKKEGKIY